MEETLDREHLVHDDAEREDVTAAVEWLAEDLLGRHIGVFAFDRAGARARVGAASFCDAEVEQLHGAVGGDHDVRRRDVAVHDTEQAALFVARFVCGVKALAGLADDAGDDAEIEHLSGFGELRHHARERYPVQVLHRDEPRARELTERENVADVLVDELGSEVRFVAEHGDEVLILREMRKDSLEHHQVFAALRGRRTREIDLCHAAGRDFREQLIAAEISSVARDQCPRRNRHPIIMPEE
jgi:hypothetical protein